MDGLEFVTLDEIYKVRALCWAARAGLGRAGQGGSVHQGQGWAGHRGVTDQCSDGRMPHSMDAVLTFTFVAWKVHC
jgi:hypothetical protein